MQRVVAVAMAIGAMSCDQGPVTWSDPQPVPSGLESASRIALDSAGRVVALTQPELSPPTAAGLCAGSVRVSRDGSDDWYAAWWSMRSDSTADVVVSRSADGKTWSTPIRVDTADVARVGCDRPPPSIDADGGNVHVAYAMTAREGPGIFASHSMDRGAMFHSPVAVVYGERLGRTAIAARGNDVAVAYEDPNTEPRRIGVALSRTMAHLFQSRTIVSPATGASAAPDVALGEGRIVVAWSRQSGGTTTRFMRTGDLR